MGNEGDGVSTFSLSGKVSCRIVVMTHSWDNAPTFLTMESPGSLLRRFTMKNNFCAWGCNKNSQTTQNKLKDVDGFWTLEVDSK